MRKDGTKKNTLYVVFFFVLISYTKELKLNVKPEKESYYFFKKVFPILQFRWYSFHTSFNFTAIKS